MNVRREPRPLILDAGALIALEKGDRAVGILLDREREVRGQILIPVGALAQVWRDGSRQVRLARFLNSAEAEVVGLNAAHAKAAGELCGRRGTNDVIDASVVILARETRGYIATSDPADISHLDPSAILVKV